MSLRMASWGRSAEFKFGLNNLNLYNGPSPTFHEPRRERRR
jgi:hypothetical protein